MPLQGELKDFSIEEIISLINEGGKSGALEIEFRDKDNISHKISVFFKEGEVAYATDGVKTGISVLETLAKLFEGSFMFVPGDVSVQDEEFKKYTFAEFKEKFRAIISEWKPLKEAFPSLNSMVFLSNESSEKIDLRKEEWSIISSIGKGISIKSLVDKLNLGEVTVLKTLLNLKNRGIIIVKEEEALPSAVLNYVPQRARGGVFGRHSEIEDETAKKLYEFIDGVKTLKEISDKSGIPAPDVKDKLQYLASIGRIAKPNF